MTKLDHKKITLRPYRIGDEIGMALLFLKIFKVNKTPKLISDIWHWKYNNSPYGFKTTIAENNKQQIVGHFGTWTVKWLLKNETKYPNQIADIILEKKYRGQKFIYNCISDLTNSGIYVYGFSNNFAFLRLKDRLFNNKININFQINILEKKINWLNFKFKKLPLTNITLDKISNPAENIEKLWLAKKAELNICAMRDWKFIKWRIIDSLENNQLFFLKKSQTIIGYVVIKIAKKTCIIQDILIINRDLSPEIIMAIETYCHDNWSIRKIRIMINDKNLYNLWVDQNYKITQIRNFMFISDHKLKPSDFYLTLADTDFYNF